MMSAWNRSFFALLLPLAAISWAAVPAGEGYREAPDGVRSRLADRLCAFRFDVPRMRALVREGNDEEWVNEWLVVEPRSAPDVFVRFQDAIRAHLTYLDSTPPWKRIDEGEEPLRSQWRFHDELGQTWRGVLEVEPRTVAEAGVRVRLSLHLDPPRASI